MNGLFVPFLDGSSIQLWDDDELCEAEVRALAPGDVEGFRAMCDVIRRLRDALRPAGAGDLWIGDAPTREQLEDRLAGDAEARSVLFDWSMAEYVEHYIQDEAVWAEWRACGAMCAAAWAWCRFTFAMLRARLELRWYQACRWPGLSLEKVSR